MELEFSLEEIHSAAKAILNSNPEKVILFEGEMGAGKTTLVKEIARALGVKGATSSPTFSLVNEYHINDHEPLYHFDMYRLKSESEAYDMGMEEYLYSGSWCFIEWAEKIPTLIPDRHSVVRIRALENGNRKINLD